MNISSLLLALKRSRLGRNVLDKRVSTIHHGIARGFKRRGGLGLLGLGQKPTPEEQFLRNLDLHGMTIFDAGANFGAFTLYFARAVGPNGAVVAFDPLPENCALIADNLRINGLSNVLIMQMGLGSANSRLDMTYDPYNTATATLDRGIAGAMRTAAATRTIEVEIRAIDDLLRTSAAPVPSFVKIDVEGFEVEVLAGMRELLRDHAPALFIELHGAGQADKAAKARDVLTLLSRLGYHARHVESDTLVEPAQAEIACTGHIYCAR